MFAHAYNRVSKNACCLHTAGISTTDKPNRITRQWRMNTRLDILHEVLDTLRDLTGPYDP